MSYSQNNEEEILLQYFKDYKGGNLLSIGENTGLHLSNCLALIESGWGAILVEPSLSAFKSLFARHGNKTKNIWCFNVAVSDFIGESILYESGEHLGIGDVALLSTLKESELKRWEGSNNKFSSQKCIVWDFNELQKQVIKTGRSNTYEFINIDAEGLDCLILKQMDLAELNCKCLCIEYNSHEQTLNEIKDYCSQFGLANVLLKNAENIILSL